MAGKCIFKNQWLENPDYNWLQCHLTDKYQAKCRICSKSFSIASMGESALKSHMKSKKHNELIHIRKSSSNFFKPNKNSEINTTSGNPKVIIPPLDSHIVKNDVLDAEILWVLNTIKNHHSYKCNENIGKLFQRMFPDSPIAAKFTCGEKKCAYYAVFGISPYLTEMLLEVLAQKNHYVLLFDESLNEMRQKKQLDIHVRFWNGNHVETKFLTSVFMGHSTAEDLVEAFLSAISPLKLCKVLQVSMDGPSVNWKFYRMLQDHSKKELQKNMLNIGSCGLHVLHNAFKFGCKGSEWEIEEFLVSLYYLFKDSPARREDFMKYSEHDCLPKKFVQHRWLENVPASECALKILSDVQKYVDAVQKREFTKPTCRSYAVVKRHLEDNLLPVKLQVFISIAKILLPFLLDYQTDKPMIFFVAEELRKILNHILQRFIKPSVLASANTVQKWLNLNVSDAKNHVATENIDLGFMAERSVKLLFTSKKITDRQVFEVRINCKMFLINLAVKIMERSPVQYSIVRNLSCLDPRKMARSKQFCVQKIRSVLHSLTEINQLEEAECDVILLEFSSYLDDVVSPNHSKFSEFDHRVSRLDELFCETMNLKQYSTLWKVTEMLLLLSHGQATVERGFSINKKIEVENLKERSYISQRLICDFVNSKEGSIQSIEITNMMRTYVSNARQKYLVYLDEQKQLQSAVDKKRKRDTDSTEVERLKKKRNSLEVDIKELLKSADDFAQKAEDHNDITFVTKSNSLRRTAKEKQEKLFELNKLIQEQ